MGMVGSIFEPHPSNFDIQQMETSSLSIYRDLHVLIYAICQYVSIFGMEQGIKKLNYFYTLWPAVRLHRWKCHKKQGYVELK